MTLDFRESFGIFRRGEITGRLIGISVDVLESSVRLCVGALEQDSRHFKIYAHYEVAADGTFELKDVLEGTHKSSDLAYVDFQQRMQ